MAASETSTATGGEHNLEKHACGDPKCSDDHSKSNGRKEPTIFDAVKTGMLMTVQNFVDFKGEEVLKETDEQGHSAAHWAALGGHTHVLRYILESKAPANEPSKNELGQRPIHWACVNGHIAIVDILLQSGVDIDVVDNKGCTPLIVACQYGKTMLVGYLIGKGTRVQLCDKDGDNALHWSAFKGYSELMRLLIYSGFNPHQKDKYGQTALHLACINGSLIGVQELCEQDGVQIDQADKNGKTPLMLAVGRKHEDVIAYLKKLAQTKNSMLPKIDVWSVIFGPPGNSKGPLLFFVVNLLCWGYPMYVIKCLSTTWYDLEVLHIFFILVNVIMWFALYRAKSSDPGFIPKNSPEYDQAIKQVAHFDEWKQGKNPLSRLCHTCRTVKPLRSKHCRVCNRCIKFMDHHCPYIYNCVGYKNRVWFLTFIFTVAVNCVITLYLAYTMLQLLGWDWSIVLGFLQAGFFTIISSVLTVLTLFSAAINLTTNERMNFRRYDYLKDGKGKFYNPYNRGLFTNLKEFFHLKKPLEEDEAEFLHVV